MHYEEVINRLEALADPEAVAAMARFAIATGKTYGVSIPDLRKLAKEIGKEHSLAQQLWQGQARETMVLAGMIADPKLVTPELMEAWVTDFNSWEVCDQCCMNLFEKTDLAWRKCLEWSEREEEFVKRAGFVLMARLAVSDKKAADHLFEDFFPLMIREAGDQRNFVKKGINWALRQIGKRNLRLNQLAIETARKIEKLDSKSARWIARDALRELASPTAQKRLQAKQNTKL